MLEKLKKQLIVIKENIAIIAILPTILGGVWQLFKLGSISISMIRFFSISQLISDGLMMLLFISCPFIYYLSFFLTINVDDLYKEKNYKIGTLFKNRIDRIRAYFIGFSIVSSLLISNEILQINGLLSFLVIFFGFNIILFFNFLIFFNFFRKNDLIEIYIVAIGLISIVFAIYSFNQNYEENSKINNFAVLLAKIEKSDKYSKKPEIMYFNDKYIFIELEKNKKKSFLIKKIDALFEE